MIQLNDQHRAGRRHSLLHSAIPQAACMIGLAAGLAGCGGEPSQPTTQPVASPSAAEQKSNSSPVEDNPAYLSPSVLRGRLGVGEKQVYFDRVGGRIETAAFDHSGLTSLEPLRGIQLRILEMNGERVADLSPLASNRLETLILIDSSVSDLSPFAGSPVQGLGLQKTQVQDISPVVSSALVQVQIVEAPIADLSSLRAAKLTELWLEKTQVSDIGFLTEMSLPKLHMIDSPIADLTPLSGKDFEELDLSRTQVTDLSPLRGSRIGILWLRGAPVVQLAPLLQTELTSLDVQDTPVADLSSLAGLGSLRRLNIAGSAVTDVTPITGLPLSRLVLTPHKIERGLEQVRQMTTLQELDVRFEPDLYRTMSPAEFWTRYDAGEFAPPKDSQPAANK